MSICVGWLIINYPAFFFSYVLNIIPLQPFFKCYTIIKDMLNEITIFEHVRKIIRFILTKGS